MSGPLAASERLLVSDYGNSTAIQHWCKLAALAQRAPRTRTDFVETAVKDREIFALIQARRIGNTVWTIPVPIERKARSLTFSSRAGTHGIRWNAQNDRIAAVEIDYIERLIDDDQDMDVVIDLVVRYQQNAGVVISTIAHERLKECALKDRGAIENPERPLYPTSRIGESAGGMRKSEWVRMTIEKDVVVLGTRRDPSCDEISRFVIGLADVGRHAEASVSGPCPLRRGVDFDLMDQSPGRRGWGE